MHQTPDHVFGIPVSVPVSVSVPWSVSVPVRHVRGGLRDTRHLRRAGRGELDEHRVARAVGDDLADHMTGRLALGGSAGGDEFEDTAPSVRINISMKWLTLYSERTGRDGSGLCGRDILRGVSSSFETSLNIPRLASRGGVMYMIRRSWAFCQSQCHSTRLGQLTKTRSFEYAEEKADMWFRTGLGTSCGIGIGSRGSLAGLRTSAGSSDRRDLQPTATGSRATVFFH